MFDLEKATEAAAKEYIKTIFQKTQNGPNSFIKKALDGKYYSGSKEFGRITYYSDEGRIHNSSGAAIVHYDQDQKISSEEFYMNGEFISDIIYDLTINNSITNTIDSTGHRVFSDQDQMTIILTIGC